MGKLIVIPLHRSYLRTCNNCGYRWQVSRGAVRGFGGRHVVDARRSAHLGRDMGYQQGPSFMMQDQAQRDADRSSIDAVSAAVSLCAQCGLSDFSQRPWRKSDTVAS